MPTTDFLKTVITKCSGHVMLTRVLKNYMVGPVKVTIGFNEDGVLVYCIDEPEIDEKTYMVVQRLSEALVVEGYDRLPDPSTLKTICRVYKVDCGSFSGPLEAISYYVAKALSGYGPLYPLVRDANVEEIAVNGPQRPVTVLTRIVPGHWAVTNIVLAREHVDSLVIQLSSKAGKSISIARPYVEAMLPEGHRLTATYSNEVSRLGSTIVIRKHVEEPFTPAKLVATGMAHPIHFAYLWLILEHYGSILIVGPVASGKTTLLQALLMLLPPDRRVVTIEDTPELNLYWNPHWDSLVTRHSYGGDAEDVDLYKLSKFALRRRPDYIVVGEVRGEEAKLLLHAASTGHGALATFHAETAEAALLRLQAPPISLDPFFLQALWVIVTVTRVFRNGVEKRKLISIDEVIYNGGGVELVNIAGPLEDSSEEVLEKTASMIVEKSVRLKNMAKAVGVDDDSLRDELVKRARFIEKLVSMKILSVSEFITAVRNFYVEEVGLGIGETV